MEFLLAAQWGWIRSQQYLNVFSIKEDCGKEKQSDTTGGMI